MAHDKGPGSSALQKRTSTKTESGEASIYQEEKVQCVWIDTWADSGRERAAESCPRGSLSYFYGLFLLGLLWPIILICLVHSPYLVYLRILPGVCVHLLAKMDSTAEACG